MFVSVILSGYLIPFQGQGTQRVAFLKSANSGYLYCGNNLRFKVFFPFSLDRGNYGFLLEPFLRRIYDREEVIFVSKRVFCLKERTNLALIEGVGKVVKEKSDGCTLLLKEGLSWFFKTSQYLEEGMIVRFRGEITSAKERQGILYFVEEVKC